MAGTPQNTDRLDLRLSRELKMRWERATELAGAASIASFVKLAATERADALIREHDTLFLSGEESGWLHEFLGEPVREPTPALQRASERHRELVGPD